MFVDMWHNIFLFLKTPSEEGQTTVAATGICLHAFKGVLVYFMTLRFLFTPYTTRPTQ